MSFWDWIEGIRKIDDPYFHKVFANHLWALWSARNQLVFKNRKQDHVKCFGAAHSIMWTKIPFQGLEQSSKPSPMLCEAGQRKIQCDAAIGEDGVGIGMHLSGANGDDSFCRYKFFDEKMVAEMGEGMAVLEAIQFVVDLKIKDLIIETDCLSLFWKMKKKEADLSYLGIVLEDIRQGLIHFDRLDSSWTLREGNLIADTLAKFALDTKCNFDFTRPIPAFVNSSSI